MFYSSVLGSALTFGIVCWGGNITKEDKNKLDKTIKKASGIIGKTQNKTESLCKQYTLKKMNKILKDEKHPLWEEYEKNRIVRSGRLRAVKTKTIRHRSSFVPRSITYFNNDFKRGDI